MWGIPNLENLSKVTAKVWLGSIILFKKQKLGAARVFFH